MKHRFGLTVLLIFSLIFTFSPGFTAAQSPHRVLILDLPRFDLAELAAKTGARRYPNLVQLIDSSGVGLMTTALPDPLTADRIYLSINSGNQVKTVSDTATVYNAGEETQRQPAGLLYQSLTGIQVPPGSAADLGLPLIEQANDRTVRASLGLFGKLLHRNSLQTAAIGNADANSPNRDAAAMLMDENGLIDWGAVGPETLRDDPLFPYGRRTDPAKILAYWHQFKAKAQVTLITLGDLERLDHYEVYLTKKRWDFYRGQVLQNYDQLWGALRKEIDFQHTMVVVFTAMPPEKEPAPGWHLTPLVIKEPGFGTGLLYSSSTRQAGIVTGYDLAVTLLNFLGIDTQGRYNGVNLKLIAGKWRDLPRERSDLIKNYEFRWPLLTGYGYLHIGLFLLMAAGLIFGFSRRLIRRLEYGYLFLLTIPAVFSIEALLNPLDWLSIFGWTLGLAGMFFAGVFFGARRNRFGMLSLISIFTFAIIMVDVLLNGYCELKSFLGYSAVAGARFYGIGNEYLGFLLGAYIVMVSVNYDWICTRRIGRYRSQLLWLAVILITGFIVHPNLGAKIGGGVTALIGLSITTYLWLERPIRFQELVGLLAALIIMLACAGIWDYYLNRSSITHFGQLLTFIKSSGLKTVLELIKRKIQLNFRIINYSGWTKVLIGVLLIVPLLYRKPPAVVAGLIQKYPGITRGFLGLTITALIGLLVNDSGIVTAATMYIFGVMMLMLVIIKEVTSDGSEA